MPTLTTTDGVTLHYTDTQDAGRPLVLIHGWPLSGAAFNRNVERFAAEGYRVITYDRRGFGRSSNGLTPLSYDLLTDDLAFLLEELDLSDVALLGFSMGGGEVARYLGRGNNDRVTAAIFSGAITPALCSSDDNPDGAMPLSGFQELEQNYSVNNKGFLDQFVTWFYSTVDGGLQVSEADRLEALHIALQSDPQAAAETILLWAQDLREDCAAITIPTLVIHGDGDINVPLAASSARMQRFIPHSQLVVIAGAPHGANVSHAHEWETAVLDFLRRDSSSA